MPSQPMEWNALLGMGLVVAATLALGVVLGLVVDSLAGTAPLFLFVGLLLGILGAIGYTVSKFREYMHVD